MFGDDTHFRREQNKDGDAAPDSDSDLHIRIKKPPLNEEEALEMEQVQNKQDRGEGGVDSDGNPEESNESEDVDENGARVDLRRSHEARDLGDLLNEADQQASQQEE